MKQLKNRYYYTVNETLNGQVKEKDYDEFDVTVLGIFGKGAVEVAMSEWIDFVSDDTNEIAYTFVTQWLSLKADSFCFNSGYPELYTDNYLNLDYKCFLSRFLEWWRSSYYKYGKLIEIFEDNKGKLMQGAGSTSTSTSDGTNTSVASAVPTSSTYQSYPSNADDVAEGSHDKQHNVTTISTENATEDVIDHLDKLNDKIHSLYSEWLETFVKRFILYVGD